MQKVNFIVTDLDDTIWDWLTMWHRSFEPYLCRISEEFGIDIKVLKKDFKELHQRYRTAESSFIYNELNSLSIAEKEKIDGKQSSKASKSILHEYYSNKKNNLRLYDKVPDTLKMLKELGVCLVGFTESNSFFTKYRIKHLKLDGIFDCIYAPMDTGIPDSVDKHYREEHWEPELTEIRYLTKKAKKPDKEILEIILKDFGAKKENTIYIGDKLKKDILMANEAGITSVYAEYGHKIESDAYTLLTEVTHWSDEEVKSEKEFKESLKDVPIAKFTLKDDFSLLLDKFEFFDFSFFPFSKKIKKDDFENVIKIWETVVETQRHFNDISLRIRNYALTAFTFIIAGIGFTLKEKILINVFGCYLQATPFLSIVGLIVLFGFFFMDKYWYHQFLKGAVDHGRFIETRWGNYFPELRLTKAISNESPTVISDKIILHSNIKLNIFYGVMGTILLLIMILSF